MWLATRKANSEPTVKLDSRYNQPMGYPKGDFADRLRYYRERRRLSQASLAEAIGSHEMTIVKLENRQRGLPNAKNLMKLAQKLTVSMGMLLGEPNKDTEPAIEEYLASSYAGQLRDEGSPAGSMSGELDFLRYQIESNLKEGSFNTRTLHMFLLAYRSSPELQEMFAAPPE